MNGIRDVEHNEYAVLSQFYDLEYSVFDADLDMYRQFAERARGPILELGCGTGRVLEAFDEISYPIVGIDNSKAMLDIASSRVTDDVTLVQRDMRDCSEEPALPHGPFNFVLSAINTFLHLPDVRSQIETLESVREVTVSGGIMLLDLFVPDPVYIGKLDGQLTLEYQHQFENGDRLDKWVARSHDLATQLIQTTVYFDVTRPDGSVRRLVDQYLTRYVHLYELEHLLSRTGWDLVSLFGNYDLEPFTSDSERILALATPQ
ncbi:MAG: class I SAM-dependent methyltransferase [Thermomicrobiales bacterium]